MALTKITAADLTGKGVVGLPDTPGLSTTEMQEKFDEIANDVLVPKHNGLIDELEADTASASLGAQDSSGNTSTIQAELNDRYTKAIADQLLSNKVDTEEGKGLTTNDFTDAFKYKLNNIEDGANNYVLPKGTQSEIGGVMGDGSTFTIDSNGVGHAIGGGGGGTADYTALINKPSINSIELIGAKTSEDYGLLRPYLVITSEAGSTVSITKGGVTIPATQITGSTTKWEVCPTSYGVWTVSSDLTGADVATTTITIDAVKMYEVTVNHITATIEVTYQSGGVCTCSKGSTVYTATTNPHTFTVRSIGTWVISVEYDGLIKTQTVSITADGQSASATVAFADIEVTYGNDFKGTTITCTCDGTVYSKVAPSTGNTLTFTIPTTGTWRVQGTVSGDDYYQDVVVSDMTSYSTTLQVFNATITVTFPYSLGASCTISDGTTTLTATTSPMAFNIPNVGTWTAKATLDGIEKNGSAKVITTDGQTESDTIEFGTIELTFDNEFRGLSVTCSQSGTTITKTAPISGNTMYFYPPSIGEWNIASIYSGQSYSTKATIVSLSTSVTAQLLTVPDGKTVTPTDNIQKWLNCAGIYDKSSYSTLADVLADSTTLLALMSSNNAVDYLVRSKSWVGGVKVPTMTDSTHPSGEVIASSTYQTNYPYYAFDGNTSSKWHSTQGMPQWIGYHFPNAVIVNQVKLRTADGAGPKVSKVQGSNDGTTWTDIGNFVDCPATSTLYTEDIDNATAYEYYRLYITESNYGGGSYAMVGELEFNCNGIVDNLTAMTDIGANNYCADTLLDDDTWLTAIINSTYIDSVLNASVPVMTSNTTPSGTCSASTSGSGYEAFRAFNNNASSAWSATATSNQWLQYAFPSSVKCYCGFLRAFNTGSSRVKNYVIQGSKDNSTFTDVTETLTCTQAQDSSYGSASALQTIKFTKNLDDYTQYRISVESAYESNIHIGITLLNFYGREDV